MGKKFDYSATEKAQLTSEGKDSNLSHLQANGARALPSSPSASGWSADAIKRQLYRPSEIIFAWLLRLASAQLALAKNIDDSLDGETKRLDLDIAGLRDLIDDIAQHGIAKYDDENNVIRDTYATKTELEAVDDDVTSLEENIDHILTLLASDESTLDTLQEIVDYIKTNKSLIDAITILKVSVSDIIDNLTSEIANKPLSAKQGKVLKGLIDALQTVVNGKQNTISDLSTIRSGASAGATAVQPGNLKTINNESLTGTGNLNLATSEELEEVKDELDSASVDVLDYSIGKVSGKDDGLALPEESQLELKSLRGNTVAWNQLVTNGNFASTDGWTASNGVSLTAQDNVGVLNVDTPTGNSLLRRSITGAGETSHKYLYISFIKVPVATEVSYNQAGSRFAIVNITTPNVWTPLAWIGSASNTYSNIGWQIDTSGMSANDKIQIKDFSIVNLTKLYGAGNEPTAITDPKAQWAINYALKHPAYDAGSLVSVNMSDYETIGFNQWDEEVELGSLDSNGQPTSSSAVIRAKNYIKVKPSTAYYAYQAQYVGLFVYGYDANYNFVLQLLNNNVGLFTIPSNVVYIRFRIAGAYGIIYNHDICINVSDSSLNGTYKPSEKNPYPISFHGKSAGSAYDERKADGTDITRIGSVDLGTHTWTYNATNHYWETSAPDGAKTHSYEDNYKPNLLSDKYQTVTHGSVSSTNNSVTLSTVLRVNTGSSETTPTGTLYFELATPVQSVNDPLPNAIKVYQNGTEWQINDGAPCGMEKDYDVSIKGQVITNVRVDARQEEEIKELKETALMAEESSFVTSEYEKTLNLWDEQWRSGYYNSTGSFVSYSGSLANENPIKVYPNTTYYGKSGTYEIFVYFYDANGNFISRATATNKAFTTPENCAFINLCNVYNAGSTYNHDITISKGDHSVGHRSYNGKVMHEGDIVKKTVLIGTGNHDIELNVDYIFSVGIEDGNGNIDFYSSFANISVYLTPTNHLAYYCGDSSYAGRQLVVIYKLIS